MRTLAACSLGGAGHFNPLVPWLDAARRSRDDVLVVGPPALRAMVEDSGYPFVPGGEPPESVIGPIREQLPVLPSKEASVIGNRDLFGRLATTAMLPTMTELFKTWLPERILRDPCEYASAVLAHRTGVPAAQVAISFADIEAGSIRVAAPALEAHERGLVDALFSMPYLTRFPASLDPSPFPATTRVREHTDASNAPLPDWWKERGGPLVYVTFGTVLGYMAAAGDVFRTALEAMAGIDARVLVTVGRTFEVERLGRLPNNVHAESWVDQQLVLPHADAVVCHAGSGTTLAALAAGVPLVAVPLFADQFENSRRIAGVGAALIVDGRADVDGGARSIIDKDDAPRIRLAVEAVLGDGRYRGAAEGLAREMAAMPTADEVLNRWLV